MGGFVVYVVGVSVEIDRFVCLVYSDHTNVVAVKVENSSRANTLSVKALWIRECMMQQRRQGLWE